MTRISALLQTKGDAQGVRLGMTNDWGSHTGFSYTLNFVHADTRPLKSDEKIELSDGSVIFVDRKALWAGEGGLLGATLDIDEEFNVIVSPKEESGST